MGRNVVDGMAVSDLAIHIMFGMYGHESCEATGMVGGAIHDRVMHCASIMAVDVGNGKSIAKYESVDVEGKFMGDGLAMPINGHEVVFAISKSGVVKASKGVESKVG